MLASRQSQNSCFLKIKRVLNKCVLIIGHWFSFKSINYFKIFNNSNNIVVMNKARHQRIISLQSNKQNEYLNSNPNSNGNFPSLRSNKNGKNHFTNNQYHLNLNLNQRKKTYLNLYTKRQILPTSLTGREGHQSKKTVDTTRISSDQTLSTQMSGVYLSSRASDKTNYKSLGRASGFEKHQLLKRHEITIKMRAKMIDWLLQIVQAYKCKDQTLFLAIHIMDQYFLYCERTLAISQLHLIGVTCIYMACKYQQIHPIRMKTIVRDIAHNKVSARDVVNLESEILHSIDFKFQRKCLHLVSQEIFHEIAAMVPQNCLRLLKDNLLYFTKLICFDFELLRRGQCETIAKGAILASIRSLPQNMKNLQIYDSFISSCGKDYEASHQICTQIIFLNLNFKSEFGQMENIHKLNPQRPQKMKVSH